MTTTTSFPFFLPPSLPSFLPSLSLRRESRLALMEKCSPSITCRESVAKMEKPDARIPVARRFAANPRSSSSKWSAEVEKSIEGGMIITDKWREWNGKTRIHCAIATTRNRERFRRFSLFRSRKDIVLHYRGKVHGNTGAWRKKGAGTRSQSVINLSSGGQVSMETRTLLGNLVYCLSF